MDIAALATSMSQSNLSTAVGIRLLAMAKNEVEQQGQNMAQMLQQSVEPNLGRVLDIRA